MHNFSASVKKYTDAMSGQTKGVIASILCSLLFALIPAYVQLQPSLAPGNVSGAGSHWLAVQRILWSTVLFVILLVVSKRLHLLRLALSHWKKWPRYALSALLVAPQYWLFVWAPANGETLSLALGYFTMPIIMVLVGRFVYRETLSFFQKWACYFAVAGTLYACVLADGISWVVLVVALGYPVYFMHRKTIPLATDVGLTVDHLFIFPFALLAMFFLYPTDYFFSLPAGDYAYYIGFGLLAVTPTLLYLYAYSKLTVSMFGLLGYVEPTLIFLVGLLIGDTISSQEIPTYLFIICALLALVLDGIKRFR
ncbi:EamA family transporter RarD [Vibrio japonicus]|uniref:EamA family transporter RarD n=1 Tax=Vibrio japonicus TaxID=1824638 RepID=A0ABY5LPB8_9VIBR|nr:EamA family transporter RarD [Vibrio japonicus]UUM32658.1 EamA family transporter RarD [Vibrio japonicus]